MAFLLTCCALSLAGCQDSKGDYRVIKREYVPASEFGEPEGQGAQLFRDDFGG